jgi:5'-deoxynucleotidase YfbR-like HD superfamily hydrolase
MKKSFEEILSEIEFLLTNYISEFRATIIPHRKNMIKEMFPNYVVTPKDEIVRESLLEHVGMLPVLAVYFHTHVTEPVNLGKVLEMLAIHDIGELVTGDENVHTKTKQSKEKETQEALKLLDPKYHSIYLEFEAQKTNEAKFATTIDKIAPDLLGLLTDAEDIVTRLKHFANIEPNKAMQSIESIKKPHMQWSVFFKEFHAELMNKFRNKLKDY